MTQLKRFLASIKVVYRKSSALTKIVVAAAIVLSIAALLTLRVATDNALQQAEALRQQAIALEQENDRLQEYISQKGTVQEILRIAKERLGLMEPDNIIIQPVQPE